MILPTKIEFNLYCPNIIIWLSSANYMSKYNINKSFQVDHLNFTQTSYKSFKDQTEAPVDMVLGNTFGSKVIGWIFPSIKLRKIQEYYEKVLTFLENQNKGLLLLANSIQSTTEPVLDIDSAGSKTNLLDIDVEKKEESSTEISKPEETALSNTFQYTPPDTKIKPTGWMALFAAPSGPGIYSITKSQMSINAEAPDEFKERVDALANAIKYIETNDKVIQGYLHAMRDYYTKLTDFLNSFEELTTAYDTLNAKEKLIMINRVNEKGLTAMRCLLTDGIGYLTKHKKKVENFNKKNNIISIVPKSKFTYKYSYEMELKSKRGGCTSTSTDTLSGNMSFSLG